MTSTLSPFAQYQALLPYHAIQVRQVVTEAIGHASMCWQPTPTGVFDSEQAMRVTESLLDQVISLLAALHANLGMATTKDLVAELAARAARAGDPEYRTIES